MSAPDTLITADLAERLERLLGELGATPCNGEEAARLAREHQVAFVDLNRRAFTIDTTVHEGALYRLQHWRALAEARAPVPMVLFCPRCGTRHVDAPDPANGWTNPPHRSHLCASCGLIWRPADIATVGVASIATRGRLDMELDDESAWRAVVRKCAEQFRLYERQHREKAMAAEQYGDAETISRERKYKVNQQFAEMCEALLSPVAVVAPESDEAA